MLAGGYIGAVFCLTNSEIQETGRKEEGLRKKGIGEKLKGATRHSDKTACGRRQSNL